MPRPRTARHPVASPARRAKRALRGATVAIATLLGSIAAGAGAEDARADGLTLRRAIDLSRENNERARAAELRVEVAEGQVQSARGAFLPTLTLGLSGTGNARSDRNGDNFSGSGTVTLRQPLLKPSAIPSLRASNFNLDAAKSSATDDLLGLEFDTARAFIAVVEAQRVLTAANARLERANADLEDVQARVDAELVSSNDATRAKLDVSSAKRAVTSGEAKLGQARLALALLVGAEVTEDVEEASTLVHDAEAFIGVSADLSKTAMSNRPDLATLHSQTLAAKASADEPLYRIIPSIDLTMQFQANPNPATGTPWDGESATLSLTWVIFDGGIRYGDKRSRDAQAQQAELNEKALERTIDSSVRTALVAVGAAQANVKEAKNAVDIAAANSEETEILYKKGLARAIELTDANGSLYDAEVAYAEAQLDLAQAYLDVKLALGLGAVDRAPRTPMGTP
ncbi:MAG: TolC family protein [Polyangiaceae bacterium]